MSIDSIEIRALEPSELRVMAKLPSRFVASRPLGMEHARSILERNAQGVVDLRRRGAVVARAFTVRGPRTWLTERPSWEKVSDGGLGRHDDPSGDVVWIHGFQASAALDAGDAAALLEATIDHLERAHGRAVAVAVTADVAAQVQAVVGPVTALPIFGHFPGPTGRLDAVLFTRPGRRSVAPAVEPERVRVAAVQYALQASQSLEASFASYATAVAEAAARGAQIVLLPELLTTEWLALDEGSVDLHAAIRAVDRYRPVYLERFVALARLHGVAIVAGTHYALREGELENVAYTFTPDGVVHEQPKLHPTPYEAETFGIVPGHGVRTVLLADVRCAVVVCYDAEFPEVARAARAGGAELLLVPYNTEAAAGHHRVRRGASARALENHVYVVTAGAVGRFEHGFDVEDHHAASAAFGPSDAGFPDDGLLGELAPNVVGILTVDLDLALLRRTLRTGAVRPWLDRKR